MSSGANSPFENTPAEAYGERFDIHALPPAWVQFGVKQQAQKEEDVRAKMQAMNWEQGWRRRESRRFYE